MYVELLGASQAIEGGNVEVVCYTLGMECGGWS